MEIIVVNANYLHFNCIFQLQYLILQKKIMLVRFAVENFKSFREEVELDLRATSLKDEGLDSNLLYLPGIKQKLLKSAVVYGNNASGKSNLMLAFSALSHLVTDSVNMNPDDTIRPYEPFRFEESSKNKPVVFEIEFFSADTIRYIYQLSFRSDHIVSESLHFYPKTQKALLFERNNGKVKFGDAFTGEKQSLKKRLLDNQLLLSKAANENIKPVISAYRFFSNHLNVFPYIPEKREQHLERQITRQIAESSDPAFTEKLRKLIKALDTGIENFHSRETDWSDFSFPENMPDKIKSQIKEELKFRLTTYHKYFKGDEEAGEETMDISEESHGTQRLFRMGGLLLNELSRGGVLIMDEFEKNFHPRITRYLIELFHREDVNANNAQFILATHDVTQLSTEVFRRDQIWFTEKNEKGETDIFRASDIEGVRKNTPLDRWYLTGRIGATPAIDDFEFLMEILKDAQSR